MGLDPRNEDLSGKSSLDDEGSTAGLTFEVVEPDSDAAASNGQRQQGRGIYLLPNLFTTAALFCGFYTIVASFSGSFEKAAIALFAATMLDGMDGRVARLTNTQSAFGAQYDSMSDLVAFGVAPAMMVFSWSLSSLGKVGWMVCFFWVACAALRLARFNVQVDESPKTDFTGLPSPPAAAVVAYYVWVGVDSGLDGQSWAFFSALVTFITGALMVSNLRYPSFKEIDFMGRVPFVSIWAVVMLFAVIFIDPPRVLLMIAGGYTLLGLFLALRRKFV